jgi:hypothetical protein
MNQIDPIDNALQSILTLHISNVVASMQTFTEDVERLRAINDVYESVSNWWRTVIERTTPQLYDPEVIHLSLEMVSKMHIFCHQSLYDIARRRDGSDKHSAQYAASVSELELTWKQLIPALERMIRESMSEPPNDDSRENR